MAGRKGRERCWLEGLLDHGENANTAKCERDPGRNGKPRGHVTRFSPQGLDWINVVMTNALNSAAVHRQNFNLQDQFFWAGSIRRDGPLDYREPERNHRQSRGRAGESPMPR